PNEGINPPENGIVRPISRESLVENLAGGEFQDKINAARALFNQAKAADPTFFAQEARSLQGDFIFFGSGMRPGLKNVLVIRQNGSVLRMQFDPTKIVRVPEGGAQIFDVD